MLDSVFRLKKLLHFVRGFYLLKYLQHVPYIVMAILIILIYPLIGDASTRESS